MNNLIIHTYWTSNPHDGYIFVEYEDQFFPEFEWFDIPSSVLCMWTDAVYEFIIHKFQETCELFFMDGPYTMELSLDASSRYMLSFCCRDELIQSIEIDFASFVDALIEQANGLRNFYLKNPSGRFTRKLQEIENNIMRLLSVKEDM